MLAYRPSKLSVMIAETSPSTVSVFWWVSAKKVGV